MRRYLPLPLLLVLAVLGLAACAGGTPPTTLPPGPSTASAAPTAAAVTGGQVNLNLFVFAAPGHKDIPRQEIDAYVKDHPNVKVDITEGSNAKSMPQQIAAFKTTPDKPLFDFGYYNQTAHSQGVVENMWDKIDINNVPNAKNILPLFRQPEDRGIAFATGYFALAYNTKFIKDPPTSYAALWDPKYKGHVALWDYQWYPLLVAAKMNGGSEKNVDPGFKVLSDNASQLHSLVSSNQQLKDLMISGDVWLAIFDIQQVRVWAEQENAPVAGTVPKEGAIAWPLYLNISKGLTPERKKVAEELINRFIAPDTLARYAAATYYAPMATGVNLPANLTNLPSMDPNVLKNALLFDWAYVATQNDAWTQRWDREVKAKLK